MDDYSGVRAGLWTLTEKLGEGGMAQVWRGIASDSPDVAIKLMPHVRGQRATFEAEAAALARLVHPHIVRILEFGHTLGPERLPYLALELARGPSLDRWLATTPVGWSDVLSVSRRVLMALAHAHARGLIHRDVKPANVLAMDGSGRDWRLTDFGLAVADDRNLSNEANPSGTPQFMAPEQFVGRVHQQGPWTDLYSFGCVLFEMLTGRPVFDASTPVELAFAHLRDEAPPVAPRLEVPEGIVELVAVLLRKDPLARFRSAADVLRALEKLPRLSTSGPSAVLSPGESSDTIVTPAFEATVILGDLEQFDWQVSNDLEPPLVEASPPPVEPPATSPKYYFGTFHGDTGPGLIGLRELPFVGRLQERRQIWKVFRDVALNRSRRLLALWGEPGIGKTAIGRWLTCGVHEHGLGVSFWANATVDPATALVDALRQTYRLDPNDPNQSSECMRRWTRAPDEAVKAVAERLSGKEVADEDVVTAALSVLWADARRRVVVLFIDDLVRDPRWLELLEQIAEARQDGAAVMVVCASPVQVERVCDVADVEVALGPFGVGECAELITELIGLSVDDAFAIAQVVDGHPHFAVEVVRDWIGRGDLLRIDGSWSLRGNEMPPLPESVGALRWQQFQATVAGVGDDGAALEVLACFGSACHRELWRQMCSRCNVAPSDDLERRALRAGHLIVDDGLVDFADRVLRRRVIEATSEERRREYHLAIAAIVQENEELLDVATVGTHLFEAGEYQACLQPLLDAMNATPRNDQVELEELVARYTAAIRQLGVHDGEEAWSGRRMEARLLTRQSKISQALSMYRQVIDTARERGWSELECDAITDFSNAASSRAPTRQDGEIAARGVEIADRLGDVSRQIASRIAAGAMFGYLGELSRAEACYEVARDLAEASGDVRQLGDADYGLGWVYFLRGSLSEALAPLHRAIDEMRAVGEIHGSYAVLSFTGDVLRALGRLDEAERAFTEAYEYLSRFHVVSAAVPANFALLEIARGRFDDALRWARRARELGRARGRAPLLAMTEGVELLAAAHRGNVDRWDEALRTFDEVVPSDEASYDTAYVLDAAARETAGAFDTARASALIERAVLLWTRLGRHAEADALRAVIE